MSDNPSVFQLANDLLLKTARYDDAQVEEGWNVFIAARYLASCEELVFEAVNLSRKVAPKVAGYRALDAEFPKVTLGRGERIPLFYPKNRFEEDRVAQAARDVYGVSQAVARRWAVLAAKDKSFEQDTLFRAGADAVGQEVQKPTKRKGK